METTFQENIKSAELVNKVHEEINKRREDKSSENTLKNIVRDKNGLIEGNNYVFDTSGKISWRKMVPPEYLVPNNVITKETDITKLKDNELLILLQGVKELAEIRGYNSVEFKVVKAEPGYCCSVCRISWVPNYETEGRTIIFESVGDASTDNTVGFGQYYLAAMAENRAFARCVRNFLRINVVCQEEMDESIKIESQKSKKASKKQIKILQELMEVKKVTFDLFVHKLKEEGKWDDSYKTIEDMPKDIIFELIERLKKYDPV